MINENSNVYELQTPSYACEHVYFGYFQYKEFFLYYRLGIEVAVYWNVKRFMFNPRVCSFFFVLTIKVKTNMCNIKNLFLFG